MKQLFTSIVDLAILSFVNVYARQRNGLALYSIQNTTTVQLVDPTNCLMKTCGCLTNNKQQQNQKLIIE